MTRYVYFDSGQGTEPVKGKATLYTCGAEPSELVENYCILKKNSSMDYQVGGADDISELEYRVVHVTWCVDFLHPNIVLLIAGCAFCLRLLYGHGLENRSSL